MSSIAHIEINVSDLGKSQAFWLNFLSPLGWNMVTTTDPKTIGFTAPDRSHIFLVQADEEYLAQPYHRKNVGLNHIAFRVDSAIKVDEFAKYLRQSDIEPIYHPSPKDYSAEYDMNTYYAIFFEDPDRIKLEVVYCN